MKLWSWLFPSDADRLARAADLLEKGRAADARFELLENGAPGADTLLAEAERQLAILNLEEAIVRCRSGDDMGVQNALDTADNFRREGMEAIFQDARRNLRAVRKERREAEAREKEAREAKAMQADPLGLTGGPSWLDEVARPDLYDPERAEIEARLALIVENYPEAIRQTVESLDPSFGAAVLDLEEGRPDRALTVLLMLPEDAPLVRWERARAAHALGDPKAAASEVRAFLELTKTHMPFGRTHSGVYLPQLLAESGDVAQALRVLRSVREDHPGLGAPLFAQLLEATNALEEAERVAMALCKEHPRQPAFYLQLARIRIKAGHREAATVALEASLSNTCCTPGQCGYQPPNLQVIRTLAILYFEDKREPHRARELAKQASDIVQSPNWEDHYLSALAARADLRPEADRWIEQALASAPPHAIARLQSVLSA